MERLDANPPPPEPRLRAVAVELLPRGISGGDLARLEESLHVSGLRWRSNNKDQLEATRKQLAVRAQTLVLNDADEKRLRDASREQLETHLNKVLAAAGVGGKAVVRFAD